MPPDYEDKWLRMGFPRELVGSGDRVLLVDDWVATGAQAETCRKLVTDAGASWLGTSVIVDGLERPELWRSVRLEALLHVRDL